VYEVGDLPEPQRVGRYRIFFPDDLPALVKAMQARGYLPEGFTDA